MTTIGIGMRNEVKHRYVRRFTTQLTTEELKQFRAIKKYVMGFCGSVSNAEVFRFLVRNWIKEYA